MSNKLIKEIVSWVVLVVIAIAIAQFITKVIVLKVEVPSGSMEDTIMIGDRVVALRQAYLFQDPKRGDIVVFPFPDDESVDYIKRIIGLPGETIEGKDGLVYINGEALAEPYVMEELSNDFGPFVIPEEGYFMMGDNRGVSEDARYWTNKFVERDKIRGKALFKYPDFTWFPKIKYSE
ncbi:MAG: signal peptidase I [Mobilitalea sp.]